MRCMPLPCATCPYHALHALTMRYVPLPCAACPYHALHALTMRYMPLLCAACPYHALHALTMRHMPLPCATCPYHALHAQYCRAPPLTPRCTARALTLTLTRAPTLALPPTLPHSRRATAPGASGDRRPATCAFHL
eukprot:scaffold76057_cov33-Phaeocystis_antarctica.AAC.1